MSSTVTKSSLGFDHYFLIAVIAIVALGLLMVASASMAISERHFGAPFHFFSRQLLFVVVGCIAAAVVVRVPLAFWEAQGGNILMLGLITLVLVLIPGIGHVVNGSRRWIGFGLLNLQASEFIKLAMVIYLSGYLIRRAREVQEQFSGFLKPLLILFLIALLLLREPDFGATVVLTCIVLTMMFLAGVRLWPLMILIALVLVAFALLAIMSPYRLARLTAFLNPWANQFGSGYQLTQSLIAFGRGGFWGVGLGGSIQKLFYLPEAHTDFLFSVLAEELGLFGILVMMGLYVLMIYRMLLIGRRAQLTGLPFGGFMVYGFAMWIAIQTATNMSVAAGLMPTKGLTLPLMSYGGSSMLINLIMAALVLRVDYEVRQQ